LFVKNNEILPQGKKNLGQYTLIPTLKQIRDKNANEPKVFNCVVPPKKNSKYLQNVFGDVVQNKIYLKKIWCIRILINLRGKVA
jgi:hypothetical protein